MKVYAISTECSARPSTAVTGGDRLSDETFTQSLLGFFDPAGLNWLTKAARLPGKSLHLAMVLVFLANTANTHQVALSNLVSRQFGLTRNAKYRALGWLEEAGLIRVERKLGRCPVVTLLGHGNKP